MELEKPKPKTKKRTFLDYHECRDYLQEKYKYDERDYGGQEKFEKKVLAGINKKYGDSWYTTAPKDFTKKQKEAHDLYRRMMKNEPEYLDFWHWVVDNYEVHNGSFISFSKEALGCEMKDWQKEIYKHYLDEFADENGELEMWVEW